MARRTHPLAAALQGIGTILLVGAVVMAASGATAALHGEWWTLLWFLVAATVTAAAGQTARVLAPREVDFRAADALATAGGGWAALAIFGALPFLLAAHLTPDSVVVAMVPAGFDTARSSLLEFRDPLHAVFESMSGWTTTGLTMATREPTMPHGFLMYRSLMQWTGGAGIIVLALSVLRQHGGTEGMFLYRAEGRQERLRPSIVETARRVWRIYLLVTAVLAVFLFVATVLVLPDRPLADVAFEAINHAMTGQSTGGFSTLDDSIAGYDSYAMDLIHLVPMISGAIALPVHYLAISERRLSAYVRDLQNRVLGGAWILGGAALSLLLLGAAAVSDPVREGVFQFVSAMSTTGWQTSDIGGWPAGAVLVIVTAMVVGGAAGATVGGVKVMRAILVVRSVVWRIQEVLVPSSTVKVFSIGRERLQRDEFERQAGQAAGFVLLWLLGIAASVMLMTQVLDPAQYSLADMIFESTTAQSTVGLSTGITGPHMPDSLEAVFILQMWLGRLEVIPVLVFLRTLFVRRR